MIFPSASFFVFFLTLKGGPFSFSPLFPPPSFFISSIPLALELIYPLTTPRLTSLYLEHCNFLYFQCALWLILSLFNILGECTFVFACAYKKKLGRKPIKVVTCVWWWEVEGIGNKLTKIKSARPKIKNRVIGRPRVWPVVLPLLWMK